jgi:hypothetical protein
MRKAFTEDKLQVVCPLVDVKDIDIHFRHPYGYAGTCNFVQSSPQLEGFNPKELALQLRKKGIRILELKCRSISARIKFETLAIKA